VSRSSRHLGGPAAREAQRRFRERSEEQQQIVENAADREDYYRRAFDKGLDRHGRPQD
jgi:hypothetical protein